MTDTISSLSPDEVNGAGIPQLAKAYADAPVAGVLSLALANRGSSQLSAIAAMRLALDAAEARARAAESLLARHGQHCICRAAHVAAEEVGSSRGWHRAA